MRANTVVFGLSLLAAPFAFAASPELMTPEQWTIIPAASVTETVNGHPLTPAPVPTVGPPGVTASERAGGPGTVADGSGPIDANPFSSLPPLPQTGASTVRGERDLAFSSGGAPRTTPNLGR